MPISAWTAATSRSPPRAASVWRARTVAPLRSARGAHGKVTSCEAEAGPWAPSPAYAAWTCQVPELAAPVSWSANVPSESVVALWAVLAPVGSVKVRAICAPDMGAPDEVRRPEQLIVAVAAEAEQSSDNELDGGATANRH